MKFEKFMYIVFCILTTFFSLSFIAHIAYNYGAFVGIIILSFYIFSYFCYVEHKNKTLVKYYVDKEKYNALLDEFLKKIKVR